MTTIPIDALITQYIAVNPLRPGVEEARIVGTGIPVWALVADVELAKVPAETLATDYAIPLDAIRAALAYYRHHKAAFDARLAANDAPVL